MGFKRIIGGIALSISFAVCLSACGDGSMTPSPPPPPPAPSAVGLWNGTTANGRTIGGLVLDDGTFWFLYTSIVNPSAAAGLVQGNYTAVSGSFTSSNAVDFNLEGLGILNSSIDGTYVVKQTLSGTIAHQAGQTTFTTTYDPDYELTPDLNLLAGTYTGVVATNETVTVTVLASGSLFGSSTSGCTFTGTASPQASGNAYNVTIKLGASEAFQPGVCSSDTVNGVAYFDAPTKRLHSAALNSTRTSGFIFIGTKP